MFYAVGLGFAALLVLANVTALLIAWRRWVVTGREERALDRRRRAYGWLTDAEG